LRRLPIRLRLTLAFAGVMALVLATLGGFLYLRFENDLRASIDQGLRTRAGDVAALVRQADSGLSEGGGSPLSERGEGFAQILDRRGRVVDASPQLRKRPLIGGSELARARSGTVTVERDSLLEGGEPTRLLATPVRAQGQSLVIVVGTSLEDSEASMKSLLTLLLVGGPAALLLASVAGYGVAAAALRPVEAMRRRAAEIEQAEPGQRLPVAEAEDEIARLGTTLNAMLDRLEAAFEREQTFVADASHELRTPLAILKTELELALRAGRSRAELVEALRSAAEETDRVAQLAEDLLIIARSDRGELPVRLAPVDAGALLEGVRERFARRAEQQGRALEVSASEGVELNADLLRLEQALGNVVDNALRHAAGPVRLSAAARDGVVELRVSDQGSGFPPAFIGGAFERFTRADDARARGGSGLGLAIVAAIARAHGGEARARNREGGGADVWIELPNPPPRPRT
jgi:two-component system OmpR family sensor kinase